MQDVNVKIKLFESIRQQLNEKSCQGFHLTSSLPSDRLENGSRQREMWTLPLDMALKQQAPIMAYGLASRNSPTHTLMHTHTYTELSLAQASCQTIVAKSAACNKRWKELEKWKW